MFLLKLYRDGFFSRCINFTPPLFTATTVISIVLVVMPESSRRDKEVSGERLLHANENIHCKLALYVIEPHFQAFATHLETNQSGINETFSFHISIRLRSKTLPSATSTSPPRRQSPVLAVNRHTLEMSKRPQYHKYFSKA